MKLTKLQIKNFRSLKNLQVDLEEYISIIVGKNNSGKTSLLLALERFLSSKNPHFELDDFNIDFQKDLVKLIENDIIPTEPFLGVSLRLFIKYEEDDDLANVGNKIIMDLDPENNWIVLDFLYQLSPENLNFLKRDYIAHCKKKGVKAQSALDFLRENHSRYFKLARRSIQFDYVSQTAQEDYYVDLIKEGIRFEDIISFKHINARRSVSNKDSDRSLSTMSAKIYSAILNNADEEDVFDDFKEALNNTDGQLDNIYADLFKDIIDDVRIFGGIREGDTQIQIKSTLQHRELLEGNTTVMYGQGKGDYVLPENFNGLGYLNLISMIFDIKIILNEFKRSKSPKPADINLLFIEEPEAHTHPQMQATFIKNIKKLLGEVITNTDGITRPLQTIISTHSAHIVTESDFEDIRYFKRGSGGTYSKNLKDLETYYNNAGHNEHYKFLKQYLTIHRSQLFFADKAILVEGETERILLPAMMRKKDQSDEAESWETGIQSPVPLLSQNISVVEVGAHSQIFEIFLDFIGIKTLIITDIDSAMEQNRTAKDGQSKINKEGHPIKDLCAHEVTGATHTTNKALQFFFNVGPKLNYFLELKSEEKRVHKNKATNKWGSNPAGQIMCVYQILETNVDSAAYHARSFEDAFLHVNRQFMGGACDGSGDIGKTKFPSLAKTHLTQYLNGGSPFEMAEKGITKKPSFAIEILLNSQSTTVTKKNSARKSKEFDLEFSNWETPQYIDEGLTWIKAD
ncbi:ATP-dependent nuclease [Photorhabdus sp. CRCIA-P01]|uniref:ATP-dependent nuclease n=1 Tax=Photorhabdus sp. CRCIA-P01 TaxID=2019570 RepID=UPI000E59EE34|nr:ATP-dependent endonuclease [Photorhabdus sp. CRCIA-P01]